ncbi:MAG: fumarylacetoacetate hydrolase family protein [Pseudomonadales bacterium]
MLKVLLGLLVLLAIAFVTATWWVSRPVFSETRGDFAPGIADPAQALTFARSADGLIWVTGHTGDAVTGINLTKIHGEAATADLIDFVSALDPALPAPAGETESFPLSALNRPLDYAFPHIAAGTNFKEHADEIYSDDPPFLFPKLVEAGRWQDPVPFTSRLDFEAELCLFPLADIDSPDELPDFGLVLCNDFTDRWTLVKELEFGGPLGLTGFASGKGRAGYLPTGYLVVIPRSPDFYLSLELSLYLNDHLRQRFAMRDAILTIEGIIAQAFAQRDTPFQKGDEAVSLMPHGNIPRGTLILTGTAAGVIFKPFNIWYQGFYLEPGDTVRTEGTWLGHLENNVAVGGG